MSNERPPTPDAASAGEPLPEQRQEDEGEAVWQVEAVKEGVGALEDQAAMLVHAGQVGQLTS
jgi:hypothetical protein